MYRYIYTSPSGDRFDLTSRRTSPIYLQKGGLKGLVGQIKAATTTSLLSPGQQVTSIQIEQMSGSLTVWIRPGREHSIQDLRARWAQALSTFTPGTLTVIGPTLGALSARVRLVELPDPPEQNPTSRRHIDEQTVQLVADEGLWWTSRLQSPPATTSPVTVEITNPGATTIHPRLWAAAGTTAKVRLPSGRTVDLAVPGGDGYARGRWLLMDPAESYAVVDSDDVLDEALWRSTRDGVVAESIPRGQSRTYRIERVSGPGEVRLEWQAGLLTPWI
ncbi:hypothetical protein OS128_05135 [Corynebacterium sp. P5848]|uniref:hypothetical protein n=1 Tax=Corynebacterium marambiense TaxID=2765364 RepID=UPI002260FF3C|nr:hypothetical protein [Corynebacterium marambiense]MCX7542294.1 hypothetical protein [Corynebacterium marambiense]